MKKIKVLAFTFLAFSGLFNLYSMDRVPDNCQSKATALDIAKYLVTEAGAEVDLANDDGNTPLMLAAAAGNLDLVRFYVEYGANIHHVNNSGETPFFVAAIGGYVDAAIFLVESGADINHVNNDGKTALSVLLNTTRQ